jgi:hypothetical protein
MLVNVGVTDVFVREANDDGGAAVLREALIPLRPWTLEKYNI